MKLPTCSGYKSWTDYGYEYDCEAVHGQECENCLCNYKTRGGLWNPETGKRVNRIIAFIFYGAKNTEQQVQPDNSPKMCEECGRYQADLPSNLCCGCDAYKEHLS